MKIAYFVNQYPKVSHSFIRREIKALEKFGVTVERFAIRANQEELIDPHDITEFEQTHYLLGTSLWKIIVTITRLFLLKPIVFLSMLWSAIQMGRRSDRGLLNHLFYFIEAGLLKRLLREAHVDHVHSHFGTNSTMIALLCHGLGGPPYSFTVHGPEEFDKSEYISLGEKIRQSRFCVAISSYGRSQLYRWVENTHWGKMHIVHCGLDTEFYHNTALPQYDSKNIVCVGRLCEQKGQLLLIEALAYLLKQGHLMHLTLAGDGPMRAEIEQLISRHNLEKYVTITGWISSEQVRSEILKARVFVLPSFAEGLPVVIMEAMVLGCPVLSTYVAGIPELVVPGENGWLVPAGDCKALADAMKDILCMSVDDLQQLGVNAKKKVLEKHSIDAEVRKLIDLFKDGGEGRLVS